MTKPLDRLSELLLNHILEELLISEADTTLLPDIGLPETTLDVLDANLILSTTTIFEPVFRDQMVEIAERTKRDVLVIRSGYHPETLDPLRVDVVLTTMAEPLPVTDLQLCRLDDGGLHLVPRQPGLCVSIKPGRLEVSMLPPYSTDRERRRGLEVAAAEIVRLLR